VVVSIQVSLYITKSTEDTKKTVTERILSSSVSVYDFAFVYFGK